jgi:hypothetical protein
MVEVSNCMVYRDTIVTPVKQDRLLKRCRIHTPPQVLVRLEWNRTFLLCTVPIRHAAGYKRLGTAPCMYWYARAAF